MREKKKVQLKPS